MKDSRSSKRLKITAASEAEDQRIDLPSIFSPEIEVAIPKLSLEWSEYQTLIQEYLLLDGVMCVHLAVEGASAEELEQCPARLSKRDSMRFFPWVKAGHRHRDQKAQEIDSKGAELIRVHVNFDCSQFTLDKIVKSLYSRKISVGSEDVLEILTTADFLQAEWLTSALLAVVEEKIVGSHTIAAFKLGEQYPDSHLCKGALEYAAQMSFKEILEQLTELVGSKPMLQTFFVEKLEIYRHLDEILSLVFGQKSESPWRLTNNHLDFLAQAYPESEDVLRCLRSNESEILPSQQVQNQGRLAVKLLTEKGYLEGSRWRYVDIEIPEADVEAILQSHARREYGGLSKGQNRLFQLEASKDSDGRCGAYILPTYTSWEADDVARLSTRFWNGPRREKWVYRCGPNPEIRNPGLTQELSGWPGILTEWLKDPRRLETKHDPTPVYQRLMLSFSIKDCYGDYFAYAE